MSKRLFIKNFAAGSLIKTIKISGCGKYKQRDVYYIVERRQRINGDKNKGAYMHMDTLEVGSGTKSELYFQFGSGLFYTKGKEQDWVTFKHKIVYVKSKNNWSPNDMPL